MAPEYIGGMGAAAEEAAELEGPQIKLGEPWSQLGGPQSQLGGPWSLLGGPQNQLGGPLSQVGGPGGGDKRTNEQTENLPILQDFVLYRGRCPKRSPIYSFKVF